MKNNTEIGSKSNENGKGWRIKYFKGLGTSQAKEFKEYFKEKRFITFTYQGKECDDSLDKAFNKKLADSRKTWLENYNRDDVLDTNKQEISYSDFVDRELIHFSKYKQSTFSRFDLNIFNVFTTFTSMDTVYK